jgi:glucosylceramidase
MNKKVFSVIIFLSTIFISLHAQNKKIRRAPSLSKIKEVSIYTSAENTNYRLTKTGTLHLSTITQPDEDVSVFVDPSQKFQSMIGIGGALTDAS